MTAVTSWAQAHQAAQVAWPEVGLPFERFAAHASRLGLDAPSAHASDLFLACAAGEGIAAAVQIVDSRFIWEARASVVRVRPDPAFVDDVCQELRQRLLVGPAPKILLYRGLAPLRAWLRPVAVRVAYEVGERGAFRNERPLDSEVLDRLADPQTDVELAALKLKLRDSFQQALREAFAALTARERNVLRLHVQGLSIDKIATPYRVDRSTAARWINRAQLKLFEHVNQAVRESHPGLTTGELKSLARLVQSQLHLSFSTSCASDPPRIG
jgi:RNA polymerase sigma-70 factor, ECF subfamily